MPSCKNCVDYTCMSQGATKPACVQYIAPLIPPKPDPQVQEGPTGTEAEVCADIATRQAFGIAKYGKTVADNPLTLEQWLQHAYEECLDQAVYLKRAMAELKKGKSNGT